MTSELLAIAIQPAQAGARAIIDAVEHDRIDITVKTARYDLVTTADRVAV